MAGQAADAPGEAFDYVIVGGGSAGATLAARLSEDPAVTICLLEAGGAGKNILVRMPAGAVALLPGRPKINNWAFQTEPQPGLKGRRGYQPRGKGLGGSSAINAMLYVRGHQGDYDAWAALGCPGWSWQEVLPYFRRAENNMRGADALHGAEGPLQVTDQQDPRPVSRAFVEAGAQLQLPVSADFNRGDNTGLGLYQVTQFHDARRGERCSAAAGYLHPVMARPNLKVIQRAQASKLLLTEGRATGVAYRQGGVARQVRARAEVILCAGAFGSPQLLMLSGIGPAAELQAQGIAPLHESPEVGQNLQDHLDFTLSYKTRDRDNFGISLSAGAKLLAEGLRWRRRGRGMLATPFAEAGGFLHTQPGLDRPDVQLHFVIGIVDDHARRLHAGHGFSTHICALRPYSRGHVGLHSADPAAAARIDPGFLSDERDLQTMLRGVQLARRIMQAAPMAAYVDRELFISGEPNEAELVDHIRARADTIYHPVGTCRMGSDRTAVVDPELRLRGVRGLRVVDASVMPRLVSGNTNAPTIMIAEKAAEMIRQARRA